MYINLDKDTLLSIHYRRIDDMKTLTITITDNNWDTNFLQLFKDMSNEDCNAWHMSLENKWTDTEDIEEAKQIALDYDSIRDKHRIL